MKQYARRNLIPGKMEVSVTPYGTFWKEASSKISTFCCQWGKTLKSTAAAP